MAQLQRRQDAVTCGNNLYGLSKFIGERERANLVVQLARFFYIYIWALSHTVMLYIFLNQRTTATMLILPYTGRRVMCYINVSEISRTPCLAHAQIYITSLLRVICTTAGRFCALLVVRLSMLLACIYLYCTHQLLAQLLHHFLLVGSLPLANNVQHSASFDSMIRSRPDPPLRAFTGSGCGYARLTSQIKRRAQFCVERP